MIARLWHGRTRLADADEYADFLKVRAAPDYGSVAGLERLYFLRRDSSFSLSDVVGLAGFGKAVCR